MVAANGTDMKLSIDLVRTLAIVVDTGTLEAASQQLGVTPSAVSQRLRALEEQIGRVLLIRSRPVRLTDAGRAVVQFARQADVLEQQTLLELGLGEEPAPPRRLAVSLDTDFWNPWLAAAARAADTASARFELYDERDARQLDAIELSATLATVATAQAGWTSVPLGSSGLCAVATPEFMARWNLPDRKGDALTAVPAVVARTKQARHNAFASELGARMQDPSPTIVPNSTAVVGAVLRGMGWAVVPTVIAEPHISAGKLGRASAAVRAVESYYWNRWGLSSDPLDALTREILDAASRLLDPPSATEVDVRARKSSHA